MRPIAASSPEIAGAVADRFRKHRVKLTQGGEPTYVPLDFSGVEWYITAVGPTKLRYAYTFARALTRERLKGATVFFSPGKSYPGEVNPRWALHILSNRDGSPLCPAAHHAGSKARLGAKALNILKKHFSRSLGLEDGWLRGNDAGAPGNAVWILPLDHNGKKWVSASWPLGRRKSLDLIQAEGPAGLRLPLAALPENLSKRALVLESKKDGLHLFFPPLLQPPFVRLVQEAVAGLKAAGAGRCFFEGYIPADEAGLWHQISLAADPGVLEINLPPCETWDEYRGWLAQLEKCATETGMRSFKQISGEEAIGTGGGNHILFGGPSLAENSFFTHPRWITSILRYWQHHPCLSYLFTGSYVGPSSQAPRPDESARSLYDLEMAYRFLENLGPGDHRDIISQTLRHLHIDGTGNTHRSEISFDKFWNVYSEGGCRGLIEFRAVESLPHAEWMSLVGLLWQALAAMLFEKAFDRELVDHKSRLHDYYFLPTLLLRDFEKVLLDLRKAGFALSRELFEPIWEWRFPKMLSFSEEGAELTVRKALEGWPLLCETPLEGGSTSRFVDTSMDRLELVANPAFAANFLLFIQGREVKLQRLLPAVLGAGLRYRRTALNPSLHPGIPPHMPLYLAIERGEKKRVFRLGEDRRLFEKCGEKSAPPPGPRCNKLHPNLLTYDLRLP